MRTESLTRIFLTFFSSFDLFSDFDFSLDCALAGQEGFKTDFVGRKTRIFFLNTNLSLTNLFSLSTRLLVNF